MRQMIRVIWLFTLLLLAVTIVPRPTGAQLVRQPVWAGRFYPADPAELTKTLADLTQQARQTALTVPPGKALKALILPHAGYIYSGWTAAHASGVLPPHRYEKVVLIGPDHRIGFRNGAISDARAWQTPLGTVRLHPDADGLRARRGDLFRIVPDVDRGEHSLEVVLPFLQYYLSDFQLVPIVLGPGDVHGLAAAIDTVLDDDTLLVVSSDLSHYLPYASAVSLDRKTLGMICTLNDEQLAKQENCACGVTPIRVAIRLARQHGWQPVLLHYSNSGDTAGGRDRVVGYAAVAFYGEPMTDHTPTSDQLSQENGQMLVRLARQAIMERLGLKTGADPLTGGLPPDPCFDERRGTFVTLTIDGRLRGCIGSLTADEPIREGVRQNAVNAAFRDPRFPPLTAEEFDRVDIEVSILTEPKSMPFEDSDDLIRKLRIDVDGVIVQKGRARATFLPQVWKQLPDPEKFLTHLCTKAGLAADAWKRPGLDVYTYQVQYFEAHR